MKFELGKLNKIKEKDIEFLKLIGKGAFGEVYEGRLNKMKAFKVAIKVSLSQSLNLFLIDAQWKSSKLLLKKLKNNANEIEKLDLLKEAIALNSFDHPNLIKFYGVCISSELENEIKFILIEYMNNGDLLTYLRSFRASKKVRNFPTNFFSR